MASLLVMGMPSGPDPVEHLGQAGQGAFFNYSEPPSTKSTFPASACVTAFPLSQAIKDMSNLNSRA